jgi:hypothetical protein
VISITLPSLYPQALVRTLTNIEVTTRGKYEVIVVSPFAARGHGVHWLEEHEPRGCAAAHAAAATIARGEYVFPFADDHEFVEGWDETALTEFAARAGGQAPFALGLRGAHSGHVGTNWGIYYPYFPLMRRVDVDRIGWIGRTYRAGFGDSDLAMRVWSAGGRCEWSSAGLLRPTPADKRKEEDRLEARRPAAAYTEDDLDLFKFSWLPHYGAGWPVGGIDSFNVDLRPEENEVLIDPAGNTFYCNAPGFMDCVVRMTN